jgi:hypothetical protein
MKIALCFYGQPRFYNNAEILEFLRDIKAEGEVDVYMHLWKPKDAKNYMRSPWTSIEESSAVIDIENIKEKIEDIYEPAALLVEEERTFVNDSKVFSRTPAPTSPEIVHRMYYSQAQVGELLKQSGKSYDLVFKMRTDSAVKGLRPLKELVGDRIWVPDNCPVMGWFNDNFSISSQENFYKIAGTYDNLSNFYHQGVDMNGEPMLKAQLTKEGVINNLMRNRFINVGLVRKENPLRIQGVWVNDEFHQMIQLEQ